MMREEDKGGNNIMMEVVEEEGKWWWGGGRGRNDNEDDEEGNARAWGGLIKQSQLWVGGWTTEQSYGSAPFYFIFGLVYP